MSNFEVKKGPTLARSPFRPKINTQQCHAIQSQLYAMGDGAESCPQKPSRNVGPIGYSQRSLLLFSSPLLHFTFTKVQHAHSRAALRRLLRNRPKDSNC